jgi:hypothetical protein
MQTTTYTAFDWQHQPHTVRIKGNVAVSKPRFNLYLTENDGFYSVYYGLQIEHFSFLSDAAKEYENCEAHARRC